MKKLVLPASIENADGSVSVQLAEPIIFGEEKIEVLKLQKPKAKHLKNLNLKEMKMGDFMALIAVLAGQFPQVIDEMGMKDLIFCTEVIGNFLDGSATSGPTR